MAIKKNKLTAKRRSASAKSRRKANPVNLATRHGARKVVKKVVKKTKKVVKKAKKVTKKAVKKVVKTKATALRRLSSDIFHKSLRKTKKVANPVKRAARHGARKVVAKVVTLKPKKVDGKKVGVVTHWFGNINVAIFKLSAPLKVGDKILIVRGENVVDDIVQSMQMNHEAITSGKKGMEVGVKLKKEVHEGAEVYVV